MLKSQSTSESNLPRIPARIIIGIAAPQKMAPAPGLSDAIHIAIEKIKQTIPSCESTQLVLSALSPLTEDADCLVAKEILNNSDYMLEVIVPLNEKSSAKNQEPTIHIKEFEDKFPAAMSVRQIPAKTYHNVRHYIVDECDMLIAFRNSKSTKEEALGLGDVIDYARRNGCPLVWINTENQGQVTVELGKGLDKRIIQDIDEYNSQRIDAVHFGQLLANQRSFFLGEAERAMLPRDGFSVTLEHFLPHLVRADSLAMHFQRLYHSTGSLIYLLTVLAIFVAAFQSLFMPKEPLILSAEIALLLIVLTLFFLGQRWGWHNKWLDYRFLAERLRSALFMALVNAEMTPSRPQRSLTLAFPPKAWMVAAFSTLWLQRPRAKIDDSSAFREFKDFILRAWIADQILYHTGIRDRYYRRHRYTVLASFVLFALTIIVVLLYIILLEVGGVGHDALENTWGLMASVFPAAAASITAIRTQRDYLRNSRLSAGMVRYLEEMKVQVETAEDYEDFLGLAREIEETMQHENRDWRVEIRFHKPEVPG